MKKTKQGTKERILDTAERLFARNGFHAASLRAITGEAGVNLAAVNYHFGSKDALLEAVFERRLSPLNEIRIRQIKAVREAAGRKGVRPSVREAVRAFIEPTLAMRGEDPGAAEFIALIGRIFSEPTETARTLFMRRMEPLFHLLFATLQEALPGMAEDLLFWRLQFTIGVLSHVLRMSGRGSILPMGPSCNRDTETLTEWMVTFVTAGMEAP